MKNSSCIRLLGNPDYILKYLEDHSNIALKSINGTDPFDFIQNFGRQQMFKNRHAQFTYNLDSTNIGSIFIIPFDYSDLIDIEYEFENGDIIKMDYILATSSSFTDINQKEFEEFYHSLIYNQTNPYLIPNLFKVKKLFQKKKGLLFEETPKGIKWDFETQDKYLKCRVDNVSHYNVFLQTSFDFESLDDAFNVMINCSKLFYSNDYKIIGIENNNGGGLVFFSNIWHQLLQQKTLDKAYNGLIRNNEAFDFFLKQGIFQSYANVETCKNFGSLKEMGEYTDDYGTSEEFPENIKHDRTKAYDFLEKAWRKRLEVIRKNNFNKSNLKNPTDILIYTDAFCFSSCSFFIKGFQNTGGAIIAGFNGNPKIEGTNEFDGSQSPSLVHVFKSQEYYELEKLGYLVSGITFSESFDDSYRDTTKSPIPREYAVDLVDRRVPIYSQYSDDIYDLFIENAKSIFNEFEKGNKCSKNNDKLLLDDKACQLGDHKKGGHPCGADGKWNLTECKAYYCELGYYYDQFQNKCILDVCTNIENEKDIYTNDIPINETKEYNIKHDEELVFHLENDSYYYFFEGNGENIFSTYDYGLFLFNLSKLGEVDYEDESNFEVNVNYYKTLKENATIKLTKIEKKPDIKIYSYEYKEKIYISFYNNLANQYKLIYNLQSKVSSVIYFDTNNENIKVYYLEYNTDVTPQEIINIDPKKFKELSNEIFTMKEDKTYIFIYKSPPNIFSSSYIFMNPKNIEQNISISNNRFLYLSQQNFDYKLDFSSNSENIYIKLDTQTLNAEIEILEANEVLNKENRYFLLKNNTQKLTLRNKNNNPALIEFLYELKNVEYLDTSKKEFKLNNSYYILKYKKSDNIKSIRINAESNTNNTLSMTIHGSIGKENYLCPFPNEVAFNKKSVSSEFTIPNDKLIDGETFNILLKSKTGFILKIELNKNGNDNGNGLPLWALISIIASGVIISILIIFIILRYCRKGRIEADNIEKGTLLSSYDKEDDQ